MKLKASLETTKGDKIVTLTGADQTIADLLKELAVAFGITVEDIKAVRFGFPPKKFEFVGDNKIDLSTPLATIGLSSGEKLSVTTTDSSTEEEDVKKEKTPTTQPAPLLNSEASDPNKIQIYLNDGSKETLQVHSIPDDNSCLFHAIAYTTYRDTDFALSYQLRSLCADEIVTNTTTYNSAVLGGIAPTQYAEWILQPDSWGGGIEIAILSEKLEVAIFVLDMDALKYEKFNEDSFSKFIVVLFTGIHYDVVEVVDVGGYVRTVFDLGSDDDVGESQAVLQGALELARRQKDAGRVFNTQRAKIVCNVCGQLFVGERDIARHAEATMYTDFGQSS